LAEVKAKLAGLPAVLYLDGTKILIAYCTNSGSTEGVAEAIRDSLAEGKLSAEVRRIEEVGDLSPYAGAIVGGPMILGWHRKAVRFLHRHREALARMPTALFFTAMQVTRTGGEEQASLPLLLDPRVVREPARPGHSGFKERFTTVGHYLRPIRRLIPVIRPLGAAFFAGKLDYRALSLPQMLFVLLAVAARPGDLRNWELIRGWADQLRPRLESTKEAP
jgi:menaquinone-dependent protoporphyrinogen IX oxidase